MPRPPGLAYRLAHVIWLRAGERGRIDAVVLLSWEGRHGQSGYPQAAPGAVRAARLRAARRVHAGTRPVRSDPAFRPDLRRPPASGRDRRAHRRPERDRARMGAEHLVHGGESGRAPPYVLVDLPEPARSRPCRPGLPGRRGDAWSLAAEPPAGAGLPGAGRPLVD